MQSYKIVITDLAQTDLDDIHDYIAFNCQSPLAADSIITQILRLIYTLDHMPHSHPYCPYSPWKERGILAIYVHHYNIYFEVDDTRHQVNILMVVYGLRDIQTLIQQRLVA